MTDLSTLKPCPFCESKSASVETQLDPLGASYFLVVSCYDCGADGPVASTEEDAIDRWNKRDRKSWGMSDD